jgi:hypothetical protein
VILPWRTFCQVSTPRFVKSVSGRPSTLWMPIIKVFPSCRGPSRLRPLALNHASPAPPFIRRLDRKPVKWVIEHPHHGRLVTREPGQQHQFERRLPPIFKATQGLHKALGEDVTSMDTIDPDETFNPEYMEDGCVPASSKSGNKILEKGCWNDGVGVT